MFSPSDETFDCSLGCDLSSSSMVCGVDGITYQSACLATCQNVAIEKKGPCSLTFNTASLDTSLIGVASFVSNEEINRWVGALGGACRGHANRCTRIPFSYFQHIKIANSLSNASTDWWPLRNCLQQACGSCMSYCHVEHVCLPTG